MVISLVSVGCSCLVRWPVVLAGATWFVPCWNSVVLIAVLKLEMCPSTIDPDRPSCVVVVETALSLTMARNALTLLSEQCTVCSTGVGGVPVTVEYWSCLLLLGVVVLVG